MELNRSWYWASSAVVIGVMRLTGLGRNGGGGLGLGAGAGAGAGAGGGLPLKSSSKVGLKEAVTGAPPCMPKPAEGCGGCPKLGSGGPKLDAGGAAGGPPKSVPNPPSKLEGKAEAAGGLKFDPYCGVCAGASPKLTLKVFESDAEATAGTPVAPRVATAPAGGAGGVAIAGGGGGGGPTAAATVPTAAARAATAMPAARAAIHVGTCATSTAGAAITPAAAARAAIPAAAGYSVAAYATYIPAAAPRAIGVTCAPARTAAVPAAPAHAASGTTKIGSPRPVLPVDSASPVPRRRRAYRGTGRRAASEPLAAVPPPTEELAPSACSVRLGDGVPPKTPNSSFAPPLPQGYVAVASSLGCARDWGIEKTEGSRRLVPAGEEAPNDWPKLRPRLENASACGCPPPLELIPHPIPPLIPPPMLPPIPHPIPSPISPPMLPRVDELQHEVAGRAAAADVEKQKKASGAAAWAATEALPMPAPMSTQAAADPPKEADAWATRWNASRSSAGPAAQSASDCADGPGAALCHARASADSNAPRGTPPPCARESNASGLDPPSSRGLPSPPPPIEKPIGSVPATLPRIVLATTPNGSSGSGTGDGATAPVLNPETSNPSPPPNMPACDACSAAARSAAARSAAARSAADHSAAARSAAALSAAARSAAARSSASRAASTAAVCCDTRAASALAASAACSAAALAATLRAVSAALSPWDGPKVAGAAAGSEPNMEDMEVGRGVPAAPAAAADSSAGSAEGSGGVVFGPGQLRVRIRVCKPPDLLQCRNRETGTLQLALSEVDATAASRVCSGEHSHIQCRIFWTKVPEACHDSTRRGGESGQRAARATDRPCPLFSLLGLLPFRGATARPKTASPTRRPSRGSSVPSP
eukprot:scaffold13386_cov214-Isochrysis_galbana.AAC.2